MANDIKYQINGQLIENAMTVDNTEDMLLVPVSIGSADQDRIIAEMIAEDSGLRVETLKHVHDLEKRIIKRLLMSGYSVNTGLYHAAVNFRGNIENSVWNPEKNTIVVNFNVGADLRQAIKNTKVSIIGAKPATMFVGSVLDASTRAQNATATPGRAFTLKGAMLKVAGTHPSVGIVLTDSKGNETKITEDLYVSNDPSKLILIIPTGLADGAYELKITTQYNGSRLLKAPRTLTKTIYIGQAPDGGGGNEGGGGNQGGSDGDQGENPLG